MKLGDTKPISRAEMFARVGAHKLVDGIIEKQMIEELAAAWRGETHDGRSQTWNRSFHASSFPGNNPMACERKALYSLMGIPELEPVKPFGKAIMEAGQDIEERITARLEASGRLLSKVGSAGEQTNFRHNRYWLVGHTDAIVLPYGYNRPHVVEIKTKDQSAIEAMKAGEMSFEAQHRWQCLLYMWFTRIAHKQLGFEEQGLEVCRDGTILYVSRDRPRVTHEFLIEWDEDGVREGLERLEQWQQDYREDVLPPRPKEWRWTEVPCKWCGVKKLCKQDGKDGVTKLTESGTIAWAKEMDPDYDPAAVRASVIDYWEGR